MQRLSIALCAAIVAVMVGVSANATLINFDIDMTNQSAPESFLTTCSRFVGDPIGVIEYDRCPGGYEFGLGYIVGSAQLDDVADTFTVNEISNVTNRYGDEAAITIRIIYSGIWDSSTSTFTVIGTPTSETLACNDDVDGDGYIAYACNRTQITSEYQTSIDFDFSGLTAVDILSISPGDPGIEYVTRSHYQFSVVPEPGTALLLGLGLFGLAASRRY